MFAHLTALAFLLEGVKGHGHVTLPKSTRNGGSLATGGDCTRGECFWFSNNVEIPGEPTLPNEFRSVQLNVSGGVADVYKTSPWRSPGSAKVYGSGCGSAGGGPIAYLNGGYPPRGIRQGTDGKVLPAMEPVQWKRGSSVEVGWAISANHGGGYSYRLCKHDEENVTEECFQRTQLKFTDNTSWLVWPEEIPEKDSAPHGKSCASVDKSQCGTSFTNNCIKCNATSETYDCLECCPGCHSVSKNINGESYTWCMCGNKPPKPSPSPPAPHPPRQQFSNPTVSIGTFPAGSQWKRDPIPGCYMCDGYQTCGTPMAPDPKMSQPNKWNDQVDCYARCDGTGVPKNIGYCPTGTSQFPEPLPHISGFGKNVWAWSIIDYVEIPADLKPGSYLMSWRWDCEESTQVWQNCADITIV